MAEQRRQPRLAVHHRVIVHRRGVGAGREGRGTTENLSEHGAMLSVDIQPPLAAGEMVDVDLLLPSGVVRLPARVQWISTVLPGMCGMQFEQPVAPEYLVHYAELYAEAV